MRLVQVRDGVLEVRWTWLPFWLAANPKMKTEIERKMRDAVLLGGVTTSEHDLDALHMFVINMIQEQFPSHQGLGEFLNGVGLIQEPT